MSLNSEQLRAVKHTNGPLLIIAGAGSGKTRVLTERLARLIEEKVAKPEEILTVTFTNKAASEIKERTLLRLNTSDHKQSKDQQIYPFTNRVSNIPWMGTFHSIAVKILRRDAHFLGFTPQFTIYDADDQVSLIRSIFKRLNISPKQINPRSALGAISSAKNELIGVKEYENMARGSYQEIVTEIYQEYQKALRDAQSMDFDDLLFNTVRLLEGEETVRDRYQDMFRYVMVDEYQDTNHAQYMMIRLLCAKYNNICVVGDDDQSIYAWRGANIRNILEFEKDFQNVEIIKLEQNYRSTQKILEAGHSVVKQIRNRKDKKLWTENTEGENISVYQAMDEKDESYWITKKIDELLEKDPSGKNIAVLYRMNAQSRGLEEACLQMGIPYRIVGTVRFYERKEVKDALAYLRIIFNPNDELSLLRIINVPTRKIGAKSISDLTTESRKNDTSSLNYLLDSLMKGNSDKILTPAIIRFAEIIIKLINYAEDHNVTDLIDYVLRESGYYEMLAEDNEENRQRKQNLEELINVATKYREMSPQASLQAFLEEVALMEDNGRASKNSNSDDDSSPITLMTIHSAKGLEFGHVFVAGVEEGIFPHSRAFDDASELDEERRLAYVALTRAKTNLYLTYTTTRTTYGSRMGAVPSRFLSDLDSDLIDFSSFSGSWGERNQSRDLNYDVNFYTQAEHGKDYDSLGNSSARSASSSSNSTHGKYKNQNRPIFNAAPGDHVQHAQFGKGVIVSIDEDLVSIDFISHGRKELATEYASLVKI